MNSREAGCPYYPKAEIWIPKLSQNEKQRNYTLKNILGLIVIMAITLPVWLYLSSVAAKKSKMQFDIFNSSNLSGKISYLLASNGGVRFRLNDAEATYLFIPLMTPLNNYTDFERISETGDSVYKPAFADTLVLIKVISKKINGDGYQRSAPCGGICTHP